MITLEQYHKKVSQLETPAHLLSIEDVHLWWQAQFEELRAELSPEDLAQLNRDEKRWNDKVNSSL